jgi:glycerol-3-phosphate dehydrogenase (NAD(P)+)
MRRVGVLGAGSWGTALAIQLARSGLEIDLWARSPALAVRLREAGRNEVYLPDAELPDGLRVTADLEQLIGSDALLMVIPSHGFRSVVRGVMEVWPSERELIVVSGTKGIETDTLARMSRVSAEEAERAGCRLRYAVLSGPTFATELAAGVPSAAVIASEDEALAAELREAFSDWNLRLYSSSDVVGVELAGAAKNVVAIASGVVTGVGLGHNTTAALITRGLHEIGRLGVVCGGDLQTFYGLAGLGDLVLTCTGGPSRNRHTGLELAAGKSLETIEAETSMVAEGVRNSLAISRLAHREGIEMPITEQMRQVIYDRKEPELAVAELMMRERKAEAEL